jgi:3-oxoacyl-[acyl-carrier-protein] synthase II
MTRVYVSGVGAVSPVGTGRNEMFDALCRGISGAREVAGFDTSKLDRHVGCEVAGFVAEDHLTRAELERAGRCGHFALAAARIALEDAGLDRGFDDPERVAVVLGTTMGEANLLGELENHWLHRGAEAVPAALVPRYGTGNLPAQVARALGARGFVQALPAACAAGNYAVGQAAREIRRGRADIVVTGASEVIERLQYAGFARLGAMSPDRVRPFDVDRSGILVGEGAGVLVLESEASLVRRGGRPLAEVGALGLACDAHHITRPHPEGEGSRRALLAAIERSGLAAADVDHVNAHGTGTPSNDVIEARVLNDVFGSRRPPVTSLKSMLGHCMGAASALEAIACVLTIETRVIPPTIHLEHQDPECDVEVVREPRTFEALDVVLNNALAFGGYDAALLLARPGRLGEFWR